MRCTGTPGTNSRGVLTTRAFTPSSERSSALSSAKDGHFAAASDGRPPTK
jgi:hypothetical protein